MYRNELTETYSAGGNTDSAQKRKGCITTTFLRINRTKNDKNGISRNRFFLFFCLWLTFFQPILFIHSISRL